ADSINTALSQTKNIKVVIENTAGQGSNLGYRFEHIGKIISMIEDKTRIGVCLDTCHTLAAGYDIKTKSGYEATMKEFEEKVGFKYLAGVHLNDSKNDVGTRKDRHDSIGKGVMGIEFFKMFMNDSRFDNVPIVLETIDETIWDQEIKMLYEMIN
ncbi:MAG: deoxyribonuclease IV, partial [Fusobacteriaceae bacterium]